MAIHCELESDNKHKCNIQKPVFFIGVVYWHFNRGVKRTVWLFEKWRFAPNFVGPCYTNRNFCHPHTFISS